MPNRLAAHACLDSMPRTLPLGAHPVLRQVDNPENFLQFACRFPSGEAGFTDPFTDEVPGSDGLPGSSCAQDQVVNPSTAQFAGTCASGEPYPSTCSEDDATWTSEYASRRRWWRT